MYTRIERFWTHLPDGIQVAGDLVVITLIFTFIRILTGIGA